MRQVWLPLAALALVIAGCGTSDTTETNAQEQTSASSSRPVTNTAVGDRDDLSDFEAEIFAELAFPPIGMTDDERACLAVALAEGETAVQDALDRTAAYEGVGSAVRELAPGCFSQDRADELQVAYEQEVDG